MKLLASAFCHRCPPANGTWLLLVTTAVLGWLAVPARVESQEPTATPPPLSAPPAPPTIPPTIVVPTAPENPSGTAGNSGAGTSGTSFLPRSARPVSGAAFVGATGCSSSMCHGGAGEKRGQWPIWSKQDAHGQDLRGTLGYPRGAFSALVLPWSNRIAAGLSIADARLSGRCTSCHAPMHGVPEESMLQTARIDLRTEKVEMHGVTCESCHGPASNWIRSHTRTDFSHAMNVQTGMRDLRNLYVRANTCVACHQNLDADILAAGHKTLYFELDSQTDAEPPHWIEKGGDWFGPQAWLVGQAVALREISWALTQAPNNGANETLLRGDMFALAWLLDKAGPATPVGSVGLLPSSDNNNSSNVDAGAMQTHADDLARSAARMAWDADNTRRCLSALAETRNDFSSSSETGEVLRSRARRLALALERMVAALRTRSGDETTWKPATDELTKLFDVIGTDPEFAIDKFSSQLDRFQKAIP
ncbi:MAG: hypothetical protein JO295_00655 [Verrucomicrobia bacterium]|nr:hypothetical protein [Verrucomicrobiota bacterium]